MKRFSAVILILLTAFVLYASKNLIPGFYFNLGKAAYDSKNYPAAETFLKTALFFNGKDRDIRYYYVKTLTNLRPNLEVQKELYEISQVNLPDSADLIADRQVSKWRSTILSNSGENYIEQVPFDKSILRWDRKTFPLKVSIENNSDAQIPAYYTEGFINAFKHWQAATGGLVNFEFTNDPKDAQITIKITPSADVSKCQSEDCKYVIGNTTPEIKGNSLERMDIVFFDKDNLGRPFSQKVIYNTALHEIGHALGIMGHSYNKDDLMYMENNVEGDMGKSQSDVQLISQVDLNTLKLLYTLIPDITNTPRDKYDTSRQFYAPIVMGSDEQINSRNILEAQNYIDAAPNLPNGYISLASALSDEKEYNSAIEALLKALDLSSNPDERYLVYYNLAIVYMRLQDWDNSFKYANLAKEIKSGADIDGLIAGINLNRGNSAFAKQSYEEILEKNPGSEVDAINLAIIYIRELNFIQAGKTLNRLVEANPAARENPKVKSFGVLMFLFR